MDLSCKFCYKTPVMFLKELGSLKMEQKEKVKYFDLRFNRIMDKFSVETKPHDSITIDYNTSTLSTSIAWFIKRVARPTLIEKYEEAIVVEKELHVIGVIVDDESSKDSKGMGKRPQTIVSKAKEKEANDIESLTHLVKSLTTEVVEIKQWTSETTVNNKPSRYPEKKNVASSNNNNQLTKFVHSSNMVLNLD